MIETDIFDTDFRELSGRTYFPFQPSEMLSYYGDDEIPYEEIPEEVYTYKGLKSLVFQEFSLSDVPKRIKDLLGLEELDLEDNFIENIPKEIVDAGDTLLLRAIRTRRFDPSACGRGINVAKARGAEKEQSF